jgi:hypothetical protein
MLKLLESPAVSSVSTGYRGSSATGKLVRAERSGEELNICIAWPCSRGVGGRRWRICCCVGLRCRICAVTNGASIRYTLLSTPIQPTSGASTTRMGPRVAALAAIRDVSSIGICTGYWNWGGWLLVFLLVWKRQTLADMRLIRIHKNA